MRAGAGPCIPATQLWGGGTSLGKGAGRAAEHPQGQCLWQVVVAESCLGVSATAALQPPPGLGYSSAALGALCCAAAAGRGA